MRRHIERKLRSIGRWATYHRYLDAHRELLARAQTSHRKKIYKCDGGQKVKKKKLSVTGSFQQTKKEVTAADLKQENGGIGWQCAESERRSLSWWLDGTAFCCGLDLDILRISPPWLLKNYYPNKIKQKLWNWNSQRDKYKDGKALSAGLVQRALYRSPACWNRAIE